MVSFHGVLWPILLVIGFHWLDGAGLVHQVQVQSFAGHAPLNFSQNLTFRLVRLVQLPSASSVPGGFVWSNVEAQWSGNH